MTRDEMSLSNIQITWELLHANLLGVAKSLMEIAPRGWVDRAGNIPLRMDAPGIKVGVGKRNRRHQDLGIRMPRIHEQLVCLGRLNNPS